MASLKALPPDHPLIPLLRNAPDFRTKAALADALLHPQDRAYSVPQLFNFLAAGGFRFGRWVRQAAYLPQCGALASAPHQPFLTRLPAKQQYAAVELFAARWCVIVSWRTTKTGRIMSQSISLATPGLAMCPFAWPTPLCSREASARRGNKIIQSPLFQVPPHLPLICRGIDQPEPYLTDIYLPINAQQKNLYDAVDGKRSIGEIAPETALRKSRVRYSRGSGSTTRSCSTHHNIQGHQADCRDTS